MRPLQAAIASTATEQKCCIGTLFSRTQGTSKIDFAASSRINPTQ
jgi:hypothetical protein